VKKFCSGNGYDNIILSPLRVIGAIVLGLLALISTLLTPVYLLLALIVGSIYHTFARPKVIFIKGLGDQDTLKIEGFRVSSSDLTNEDAQDNYIFYDGWYSHIALKSYNRKVGKAMAQEAERQSYRIIKTHSLGTHKGLELAREAEPGTIKELHLYGAFLKNYFTTSPLRS
jgi:hypothetical protein